MIIAGTIRNSVSLASLESKWQQKKQGISKGNKENLTAEERELQRFQEQADNIRESKKSTDIDTKLQAGGELTAEEIEYLKKNDPDALKEYEEVQRERASYKKQLKDCKSKEEVEKLKMTKMGHYMAEAKEITNDPYIPKAKKYELMQKMLKKTSAIEAEQEKFLQSSRYAKLPDEEKEARKKEHMDAEAQQEGTTLSDVSLSGEAVDALEEIKRMAGGLRFGTSENVTNQKTGATAGSIDLKI
ncbi:hypothetical protein IMSAGC019_00966 [Lachnospiraceae bacterium]|nr:hypothetical protein IMSAGC019_00966 [Lachnospiraceae bacterium]